MELPPKPVVLVVEDEEALASLYERWLMDTYAVRVANTGEEALRLLDGSVDAVLLDRRLPDRRGADVLRAIRDLDLDVGVALITAVEPEFDILELGFDKYLVKPVDFEALHEVVLRLLERQTYPPAIKEYFSLLSKQAVLEQRLEPGTLQDSEEFDRLESEIDEIGEAIRPEP